MLNNRILRWLPSVKSQDVVGWAGLWMRVDQGKDAVAFDNMQDRSIKGTTDWRHDDVILSHRKMRRACPSAFY